MRLCENLNLCVFILVGTQCN